MKRVVFLIFAVLLVAGMMQASDMRFGAKAGLTLGNINKDVEDLGFPSGIDKKMRMGMTFGAMLHMPLSDNTVFMGEGAYIQKGVTFDASGDEMTMKFDYIQFDALVKYLFSPNFGFYAGPGMGFVMTAEEVWDGGSFDLKDEVSSTEFSLNFGGQFMATENIVIDARYNMGMSDIPKEDDDFDLRSRTISFTVGYLF
ncbi:MAG TPA: porin family protein [Candidatus Mcinerneyibacteriales bacterium]|nr:porin family protein [Candidatus Mcinerneyibacteriales bacterium]HPE28939.1 porin family protein [Candidatus Mcinerneyibacteriales bacterium]HPJ69434.1 porin family protein [Candidatus Mcinerneyibacteriales bacterium]HPQ89160.1 porin family protein [Candidatus Mcinerneyibacteriales bacterium]